MIAAPAPPPAEAADAPAAARPTVGGLPVAEVAALTRRITTLSVGAATVLTLAKGAVWAISGSVAVLASAADSALDLVAALASFFAVRYAAEPPDAEHRYGHGKAEAFASLLQAALVFASAALVGQAAVRRLLHPEPVKAEAWAAGAMIFSIVLTALLILAQTRILRRTRSVAVAGDRSHYAADLASNLAALVAVGLAGLFGWAWADAVGGLAVALWLVWGSIDVLRESSRHLMDREVDDADRQKILELASADPRVKGVHQLRTRASGPYLHVQMHMDLDPHQTLEQAHRVVIAAEKRILAAFPAADILIHPDPRGRAEPHGGAFSEADET